MEGVLDNGGADDVGGPVVMLTPVSGGVVGGSVVGAGVGGRQLAPYAPSSVHRHVPFCGEQMPLPLQFSGHVYTMREQLHASV